MSEAERDRVESTDEHPLSQLIRTYARPHALGFGVGLGALLLARIPQRIPALLVGVALDAILLGTVPYAMPLVPDAWIPTTPWGQVQFTLTILAAAVIAESLFDYVADYHFGRATLRTLHDIRTETYEAVTRLELSYFDDERRGDVLSVVNNDVNNLEELAEGTKQGVNFSLELLVAFLFMLALNWQLALAVAAMPISVAAASRLYANALEPRYDRVRESVGGVNSRLEDAIAGITTVKAFTGEPYERERVRTSSRAYKRSQWSAIRLRLAFDGTTWMLSGVSTIALLALGGYWVLEGAPLFLSGELSAGVLLTFLMYTQSFFFPTRNLAVQVVDRYENAHASAKRVVRVLREPAVGHDSRDAPGLAVDEGHVEFDDVSFGYDGADEFTLRDVDVTIDGGDLVGVVGSTGAGKSTLLKLLFRFYEPDRGTIRIDGQDIADVNVRSLREEIGLVSQDPFLFYGTVHDNVAYAMANRSREDVVAAAKLAGAHEFVQELSEGYDTQVGERGVKLSGGQRQRIAIARAILRDPSILVLDEATSHVDNETERHIQRSLEALAADRTTFVIAHRLSTVRDADRILVVDDGEIVEQGTHDELLEADGIYADLWRIQVGDIAEVSEEFAESAAQSEVRR